MEAMDVDPTNAQPDGSVDSVEGKYYRIIVTGRNQ